MNANETTQETAMTVDPVIAWLEQVRDFALCTPQAKEMTQRAIDRLRPPALDVEAVIRGLLRDFGQWRRTAHGAVVSDQPTHLNGPGADDIGYYGGHIVGESIGPRAGAAIAFLPELMEAAFESKPGRAVLERIARLVTADKAQNFPVFDELDASVRLAQLAQDFERGALSAAQSDAVAHALRQVAIAVLSHRSIANALDEASGNIRSTRAGGTS